MNEKVTLSRSEKILKACINGDGTTYDPPQSRIEKLLLALKDKISEETVDLSNYYTKAETYSKNEVDTKLSTVYKVTTITVPTTGWTTSRDTNGTTYYSINITDSILTSTGYPISDVVLSSDIAAARLQSEAYQNINKITVNDGSLDLYCFDSLPTVSFQIRIQLSYI